MRLTPPTAANPGPDETIDQLIGGWWIYQLKAGHRFSTDDLLTAWRAAVVRPAARTTLDLGSGVGSVGLYLLGMLEDPAATQVGVEAQEVSHALALRSVALNGLGDRVTRVLGDLRDPHVLPEGSRFELITGSPPYVPLGKGVVSPHPQRAACRMELRGSVYDYCEAAARWLAPGGRFVYVMSARDPRTEQAPLATGWVIEEWLEVTFREGEAPMIAVVTCARADDPTARPRVDVPWLIRQKDGRLSDAYADLRRSWGWSVDDPRR